ncbi:hypothetical protein [Bacillus sp. AFS017336]|uniref:hypothetical protein n=1 Tax=Bacillus sp. AFS017336 TaxID=2033489 RepID=UPI001155C1AF|nr:hypothetical protein [Bacillus sp. AFS017336]
MSGDLVSLQERFNIPRSMLKQTFKGADTAKEKIAALDKVLNQLGFTQKFVNQVNTSASAQWMTLQSNVTTALVKMGTAALQKLKKPLTDINNWIQGGGLNFLKEKGSDFLAGAVSKAVELGSYIKDNWPTIKQKFQDFNTALEPIKTGFSAILTGAQGIVSLITSHWSGTISVVLALTAAVVTFRAAMLGLMIIQGVIAVVKGLQLAYGLLTGAQWALNVAMDANPVGAVIIAIAALAAGAVLLYRNWDLVKTKTVELWNKMGPLKSLFLGLLGPIGLVVGAVKALVSSWDSLMGKIRSFKMPSWVSTAGSKIGSMVGIGGGAGKSHAGGLANVPYNGYQATLHKGERVMTPEENDAYNKGNGKGGKGFSINIETMNVRKDSDINEIADKLARKLMTHVGVI